MTPRKELGFVVIMSNWNCHNIPFAVFYSEESAKKHIEELKKIYPSIFLENDFEIYTTLIYKDV